MKTKRELADSHEAWRIAAKELDAAIGIEIDTDGRSDPQEVMDIRRFRRALLAERDARKRYVDALRADGKPVSEELVWDFAEDGSEVEDKSGHRRS